MGDVWALGYATKGGMVVKSLGGEKFKIKAVPVGKMHAPDADEFVEKFLNSLKADDVVLSPAGPNHTYIAGCASICKVLWIHSNKLPAGLNGKIHEEMFRIFQEDPENFYEFQATGIGIAQLRLMVQEWMGLEQQVVADGNALSQALKREKDFFAYFPPERNRWIDEFVKREVKKDVTRLKKRGVILSADQTSQLGSVLRQNASTAYDQYFEGESEKIQKKGRNSIIADRLEWFGVDQLLDHVEKETKKLLQTLPENSLFDGLISDGTHRVRAQILAYMRNPLLYPNVRALIAYADVGGLDEGQVVQRRHGMAAHGNPKFRKTLCFDFAEKYWQNDTVGYFRDLYYAIKAHQYYMYWDLMEVTVDVFKALGKKVTTDDENVMEESEEDPDVELKKGIDFRSIIERLKNLANLPIIERGKRVREEIEALEKNPDPKRLWNLFSRAGLNLQMTPKRIEQQVKRLLGITLLKSVYYRWLESLGAPVPLSEDFIYVSQFQKVCKSENYPQNFDHEVVLKFYRMKAAEFKAERKTSLPDEIEQKFVPPSERKALEAA